MNHGFVDCVRNGVFYIIWRGAVAIILNDCTIGDVIQNRVAIKVV